MKLKTIILTTALAATTLVIPASIHAQTATPAASVAPGAPPKFGPEGRGPGGEGRPGKWNPEERVARLKEALALTPDQEAKIRDILKTEAEKAKANREANKGTPVAPEERRAKMQAARTEVEAAIKAVLTPEQQTKFDAMKKERGPKGGPKGDAPAPAAAVPTP